MEDSGLEWIIYGIAMLVGMIGMINKARKQARQSQAPQPQQFPWDEFEEGETVEMPRPVILEHPFGGRPEPQAQTAGEAMRKMVAPEGGRTTHDLQKRHREKPRAADSSGEGMRAAVQAEGGRITRDTQASPEQPQNQGYHIEEQTHSPFEFDLRKAVVYSEILKPKYDEY